MCTFTTLFEIKLKESTTDQPKLEVAAVTKCLSEFNFIFPTLKGSIKFPFIELYKNILQPSRAILLSCYRNNLITLDLNEFTDFENEGQHRKFAQELQDKLKKYLPNSKHIKRISPIKRGRKIWNYSEYSDGRLCEESYTEILFDQQSKYQQVTIARCEDYGNTLILDDLENLSEGENSYTVALCGLDEKIEYKGKTILILGGGDGGALYELRKRQPSMITMVEIDEVVMQACRKHLRGCCGDSLDSYNGDNYEIIVGDCLIYLDKYIKEGRTFDYVISDITDVPIEVTSQEPKSTKVSQKHFHDVGEGDWIFFDQVYNSCLKIVKDGGLIMTHVTAAKNERGIERFKKKVGSFQNVEIKMRTEYIPSFCEGWTFCKIKKEKI